MKKTLLIIDSAQRVRGTSTDFLYSINYYNLSDVNAFRVNKITVPYSFYNLKAQTFTISQGGPTININFPAGSYSANTLAQKLSSLINASLFGATITINFLADQNKFEFIMDFGTITINFLYDNSVLGNFANYNLSYQLGISPPTALANPPNFANYTSPLVASLSATSNLYLASPNLNLYEVSIFNKVRANIIQSIPVNVNSYNFIIWENSQETIFKLNDKSIGDLNFQLLDDYNNVVDLNGLNMIIELQLYSSESSAL